jgi:DNA-binding transcriptional ArsR family regulator
MLSNQVADTRTQDVLVIRDPQVIRLMFSKKHNMILKLVTEKELSISDIARSLNINPGSVHYHLKDLERHGLAKLVREEVKGGIVKKYYRSAAKQILLDSPDFNKSDHMEMIDDTAFIDRMIGSIEHLGYHISPENRGDAKEMLLRFDQRIKRLFDEVHRSGLEKVEQDENIIRNVGMIMMTMRTLEDPEIGRIYREFNKLFVKNG